MGLIEDPTRKQPAAEQAEQKPAPAVKRNPRIGGAELTDEQWNKLQSGGHIYLENMKKRDGGGVFSAYVFLNDEKKKAFVSDKNPDKWSNIEM